MSPDRTPVLTGITLNGSFNVYVSVTDTSFMWGQLRTLGPWRIGLIAFSFVVAALAVWTDLVSHSEHASAGTPAQQASADQMIMSLQPPPGAVRDRYDSACIIPDSYCITSTTVAPQALMADVISSVRSKGAKVISKVCAKDSQLALLGRCLGDLSYRGARLRIATDTRGGDPLSTSSAQTGRTTPTWLYVAVLRDSLHTAPSAALGTWAVEDPLPAAWHVTAVCTTPTASGCRWYGSARVPVALPVDDATTAARAAMERLGYAALSSRCFASTASLPARCMVQGSRYRRLGGGDGEIAVVSIRRVDAHHVSVLTQVSAS